MFRYCLVLAALVLISPGGRAQTAPPTVDMSPSKTIWDVDLNRTAINPQTELQCPAELAGFQRNGAASYIPTGMDISCGYRGARGAEVTIYLARYSDHPTAEAYLSGAKSALTRMTPDAVVREEDAIAGPAGLPWVQAGYTEHGGNLYSDIWVAPLGDWMFQLRVTYPPSEKASVSQFMSALSVVLGGSAIRHINACSAAPMPSRDGRRLAGQKLLLPLILTGTTTAGASLANSDIREEWCVEVAMKIGDKPFLYWRNIAENADRYKDRITAMDGSSTTFVMLDAAGKAVGNKVAAGSVNDDTFDLVVQSGDQVSLIAIFDGRPSLSTIGAIIGKPHGIYATLDRSTKKMSVYANVFADP